MPKDKEATNKDGKEGRILEWKGQLPPPIPHTNYAAYFLNILTQYADQVALVSNKCTQNQTIFCS